MTVSDGLVGRRIKGSKNDILTCLEFSKLSLHRLYYLTHLVYFNVFYIPNSLFRGNK